MDTFFKILPIVIAIIIVPVFKLLYRHSKAIDAFKEVSRDIKQEIIKDIRSNLGNISEIEKELAKKVVLDAKQTHEIESIQKQIFDLRNRIQTMSTSYIDKTDSRREIDRMWKCLDMYNDRLSKMKLS